LRISASMIATWEQVSPWRGRPSSRHDRDVIGARARKAAGTTFDELVQWMVQDASPDHCDRWGPKLT
jgi:hypothetical protein